MQKFSKLLVLGLAVGMMTPMAAPAVTHAATQTGTTDVSYDNTNMIPDPGNPTNPNWGVKIPSSIQFTDANQKVDTTIELVSINGGALPTTDVTVTVASAKTYKMNTAANDDPVDYSLLYGGNVMSNTAPNNKVGVLKAGATKAVGSALMKGTAKKTGNHTDTLTYTISN